MNNPEPCTDEAIADGCTCRIDGCGNDPDARVKLDEWCPLHGRDPDHELEILRDGD